MVKIIPMSAKEAIGIEIACSTFATRYGNVFIASTSKGICSIGFCSQTEEAECLIMDYYPAARIIRSKKSLHLMAVDAINGKNLSTPLHLHLKGSPFRLKVWRELLCIPQGTTVTYRELAKRIGNPGASRAVGSAVGANPVSLIVPCHRVVRSDGTTGQYHWGANRKAAILADEATEGVD